ncbi:hypothetical protein HMPREF9712_03690 [Myroides odoratimimus CCUG 10230]|uniref:Uncharacterized protein n=1 Tax=Myroides odoratimimus CCUG 10230 TaxID=883150 RepID=A0ABN0MMX3_9FLAO|nr:hypothetical protein HMPREF9712_03690 [Myroides odoratimimus CCUG 10230]
MNTQKQLSEVIELWKIDKQQYVKNLIFYILNVITNEN